MNTSDNTLDARSITLAERAYRFKANVSANDDRTIFDEVGDELIRLENPHRFYDAQTKLEATNKWTEEKRALAHELNDADKTLRSEPTVSYEDALGLLEQWMNKHTDNGHSDSQVMHQQAKKALLQLELTSSRTIKKQSLNTLMDVMEAALSQTSRQSPPQDSQLQDHEKINQTVCLLRRTRDALLVYRMLNFDNFDLLKADAEEEEDYDRVSAVRQNLAGIYAETDVR